jgi:uncharacterized protein
MIIDFHNHIGKENDKIVSISLLERHLKNNQIRNAVAFPFSGEPLIQKSLKILKYSRKHKFIIPFLRFNPKKIRRKELEDLLKKGFRGIKLHPRSEEFDPLEKNIQWVFEVIQKYRIPILIHCKSYHFDPNSHPEKLLKLAKKHPKQIFVFGHFAGVNKSLFKEFMKHENIYVETSIDVTPNAYREVTLKIGFDRLLFGTDFPFSFGEIELEKLRLAKLPKKITQKILYQNAQRILSLK